MPLWLILALAVLGGAGLGFAIGRFTGRHARRIAELKGIEEAFAAYKGEVANHFEKTAQLFSQMTQSYRAVYEHLAESAERLTQDADTRPALKALEDSPLRRQPAHLVEDTVAPRPAADPAHVAPPGGTPPPLASRPDAPPRAEARPVGNGHDDDEPRPPRVD